MISSFPYMSPSDDCDIPTSDNPSQKENTQKNSTNTGFMNATGLRLRFEQFFYPHSDNVKRERILLIMGFACRGSAWKALQRQLAIQAQQTACPIHVVTMDNRGIGDSTIVQDKKQYTTTIMAQDALAVMDQLCWPTAHIVGFSMGGMISMKLASLAPSRLDSLTLLSVTGGGLQCLPRTWKGWKYALMGMMARTSTQRALSDIKFHFCKRTRNHVLPNNRAVMDVLMEEYAGSDYSQPPAGQAGHANACMTHKITKMDIASIKSGGFPIHFMHGRHDQLARFEFGEALAAKLHAPFALLDGGHFIPRECSHQVALAIMAQVRHTPPPLAHALAIHLDVHANEEPGSGAAAAGGPQAAEEYVELVVGGQHS